MAGNMNSMRNRKTSSNTVKAKPVSGLMNHPRLVIGGTHHKQSTSFTPEKLALSEQMKLYRDQGIVWVAPTRGSVYTSVVVSWLSLAWPQNHIRSPLLVSEGAEVADAYNGLFDMAMSKGKLGQMLTPEWAERIAEAPFVLTTEEDNVIPNDAIVKLLTAIHTCPDCGEEVLAKGWQCKRGHKGFDAVSGLYFIKTDPPIPMAFGKPKKGRKFDFCPVSVADPIKRGAVIEVNGLAMGCALWRKDLFRRMKKPWFRTTPNFTQDLYFCKRAKEEQKARFGVHCGIRVAHYNPMTKQLF